PWDHVLGGAQFCGLRIGVAPGVFVPRRRTEFLVSQAIALASRPNQAATQPSAATRPPAAGQRRAVVVDLCCGSGALGVAVAMALGGVAGSGLTQRQVELHAADLDPVAVRCARPHVAPGRRPRYQGGPYPPLPAPP